MLPALRPGQLVMAFKSQRMKPGDVVILRHNGIEKVKRIHTLTAEGAYVLGDNQRESTDSRQFGVIPLEDILGKVVMPRLSRHV